MKIGILFLSGYFLQTKQEHAVVYTEIPFEALPLLLSQDFCHLGSFF